MRRVWPKSTSVGRVLKMERGDREIEETRNVSVNVIVRADGDRNDNAAFDQEFDGNSVRKVEGNGIQIAEAALQFVEAQ